jgi:hypothetical protein
MAFGLRNAAQALQRLKDNILMGLDYVFSFLDDDGVFSKSKEQHWTHLRTLFTILAGNATLRPTATSRTAPGTIFLPPFSTPPPLGPPATAVQIRPRGLGGALLRRPSRSTDLILGIPAVRCAYTFYSHCPLATDSNILYSTLMTLFVLPRMPPPQYINCEVATVVIRTRTQHGRG